MPVLRPPLQSTSFYLVDQAIAASLIRLGTASSGAEAQFSPDLVLTTRSWKVSSSAFICAGGRDPGQLRPRGRGGVVQAGATTARYAISMLAAHKVGSSKPMQVPSHRDADRRDHDRYSC